MHIKKTITGLDWTADDWELYEGAGRHVVAEGMNNRLMDLLNSGVDPDQVYSDMLIHMGSIVPDFGQYDTEPRAKVRWVIRKFYPQWDD